MTGCRCLSEGTSGRGVGGVGVEEREDAIASWFCLLPPDSVIRHARGPLTGRP